MYGLSFHFLVPHTSYSLVCLVDISEMKSILKEIEERQRETEAMLSSMINAFVLFESVFDDDGNFISYRFKYINEAYERITGVRNEEVKGKTVHEVWPETEPEWIKRYGEVAVTGKPQSFELYHDPTGKDYFCNVYRPYDSIDRFCVIFEDITERKITQKLIEENERRFRSYIMNAPYGIFIADREGNYVEVNPEASEITGYSRDELIGMNLRELVYQEDMQVADEGFKSLSRKGKPHSNEIRFVRKDGEIRYWIVNATLLSEDRFLGFTRDITDRKKSEIALLESEKGLREAQHLANIGSWNWNLDTGVLHLTEEMYNIIGLDRNESALDVSNHEKYYTPESWKKFLLAVDDAKKTGEQYEIELEIIRKNGENRKVVARGEPIFEEGKIIGLKGTLQDITTRKKNENRILELQKKLKLAMTSSEEGIWEWNLRTNLVTFDEIALAMVGFRPDEVEGEMKKGTWWIDRVHPDDRKEMNRKLEEYLNGKSKSYHVEFRLKKKTGGWLWIASTGTVMKRDEKGNPELLIGIHRNINKRKLNEESLKKSEAKIRNILENTTNMFYSHDVNNNITFVSPQSRKILGYEPEEMMKNWMGFISDHPINEIASSFTQKAIDTGERQPTYELQLVGKDGSKVWVEVRESPKVVDGKVTEIIGSLTDITYRKITDEILKQSEERLRKVLDNSPFPTAVVDVEDRVIEYWSQSAKVMFGHDPKTTQEWYQLAYPDSEYRKDVIDSWKPFLKEAMESDKPINAGEYNITCRDGTVKVCEIYAMFIPNNLIITLNDVTEMKNARVEIENAKEEVEFYMDLLGHDLGNIHQGISGSLQLLQKKIEVGKKNIKLLNLASESIENATSLTKEVILLSKLRDKDPKNEYLKLKEIIDDAIDQMKATFPCKEIQIEEGNLDHVIRAEPLVKELFINILHNGIRLQNEESWIGLDAVQENGRVQISISDKGPGIPDSMKHDLFKRFGLKGEKIRRGLGLSIAKVLAERYEGNIWVEDRVKGDPSRGAKFLIELRTS
jgi:PAS domain S-box-containing protein